MKFVSKLDDNSCQSWWNRQKNNYEDYMKKRKIAIGIVCRETYIINRNKNFVVRIAFFFVGWRGGGGGGGWDNATYSVIY